MIRLASSSQVSIFCSACFAISVCRKCLVSSCLGDFQTPFEIGNIYVWALQTSQGLISVFHKGFI